MGVDKLMIDRHGEVDWQAWETDFPGIISHRGMPIWSITPQRGILRRTTLENPSEGGLSSALAGPPHLQPPASLMRPAAVRTADKRELGKRGDRGELIVGEGFG